MKYDQYKPAGSRATVRVLVNVYISQWTLKAFYNHIAVTVTRYEEFRII